MTFTRRLFLRTSGGSVELPVIAVDGWDCGELAMYAVDNMGIGLRTL